MKATKTCNLGQLEQRVFQGINALVEPAVRRGIGSPTLAPASLIVLETTGFKSGQQRRTPLWSLGVGRYRIVSTLRGDRSFWVKNLLKQPNVRYYLGGKARDSRAVVFAPGNTTGTSSRLNPVLRPLANVFTRLAEQGWAFAILSPAKS